MASAGIISFKLIINLCRRLQLFLQTVRTYKRRRAVHLIKFPDILGNLKVSRSIVQLLPAKLITENASHLLKG